MLALVKSAGPLLSDDDFKKSKLRGEFQDKQGIDPNVCGNNFRILEKNVFLLIVDSFEVFLYMLLLFSVEKLKQGDINHLNLLFCWTACRKKTDDFPRSNTIFCLDLRLSKLVSVDSLTG